jgi:hypothetical protein
MFGNPAKIDPSKLEGTVTAVDTDRLVANVTTLTGQKLIGVPWLIPTGGSTRGSDSCTPHMGDRVYIDSGLGHPVIIGSLPKWQTGDNSFPLSIDSGTSLVDTGNFTTATSGNAVPNQNKPQDMLQGDRVLGSFGGGMIAILRGGSLLLKSSSLASIFVSKLDDVVKIVSRNWIHFSDVATDVMKNIGGRIYRYTGYTNDFTNSKEENYQLNLYYGDTALAEVAKSGTVSSPPATNTIIFKEQIEGTSNELYHRTLDLTGNVEILITGAGGTTRIVQQGALLTLSCNDQNTITIDPNQIKAQINGGNQVTLTSNEINLQHTSGAQTQLTSSGAMTTFGGHFCNVTAGGVQLG